MKIRLFSELASILLLAFCSAAIADGFRPESDLSTAFVNDVAAADIVVYPTIVRDPHIARYSTASQQLVIDFLEENGLGKPRAAGAQVYLGGPEGDSQFEFFDGALQSIGNQVRSSAVETDYVVVLEVLFAPARDGFTEVFGIHVYILTPSGDNAFSFLLNSHHKSFSRASLGPDKGTAKRKEKLAIKATSVALMALVQQMSSARACAVRESGKAPALLASDLIDDFESGLPGGYDQYRVPLGFSTFNGKRSSATLATTTEYPPRPAAALDNKVLKLDMDVKSWAGVLHSFENEAVDRWVNYDWSGTLELSFWLYGQDSGTMLVVDVLDNRSRCSTMDDAERYSYSFVDNFSGWKLISIPFEVMGRKEIGNGAPNDGLGLTAVHGWGFATLRTDGEITYYIDDVTLRRVALFENVPDGLSRETDIWSPVNELPMYGEYEKTAWQKEADAKFFGTVLPEFAGDHEAAAEHFARTGWNLYYLGDRSTAIKRFNQAWMLDPHNQNALWGFAVVSRERGKPEASIRFYKMALQADKEIPKLKEEYEQLSADLAR